MKKNLFLILSFLLFSQLYAQDIIVKTDGTEIKSKVTEITLDFIKYKNFNQPDGPIRNISIKDVYAIKYQDGTIEEYKKAIIENNTNAVKPIDTPKPIEQIVIKNKDTITNQKIIDMAKSSMSTPLIIYNIHSKVNCFNLSDERLMDMCDYGIPIDVILEMKNSKNNILKTEAWTPKNEKTSINDAKIVKWTKLKIPLALIIEKIDNSILDFNTSADSLIYLVENKVAPEVIDKINKTPIQKQIGDTLTNTKIIKLVKCGFYKNIINSKIQVSIDRFDLSTDGLINLGNNGVGIAIINEMIKFNTTVVKNDTLNNAKIIQLSNIGYSPSLIINKIQTSVNNFDLSSVQLKNLQDKNVYPEVLDEMKRRNSYSSAKTIVPIESNNSKSPEMKENVETPQNLKIITNKTDTLTNEKIIQLTKIGIPPSSIILMMQKGFNSFDLSVDGLINLGDKGVDKDVINEMIKLNGVKQ